MKYSTILFDFDGTIVDSSAGIKRALRHTFSTLGMEEPPDETLRKYFGPPLVDAFMRFAGMSEAEGRNALSIYREFYSAGAMFECEVYDGVPELLNTLRKDGVQIALATCKPHIFAKSVLERVGLLSCFDFLSGPELDGRREAKKDVIAYAIEHLGIKDLSGVLMVGDRDNDVLGAKSVGIPAVGALWGFGSLSELTEAGAVSCISSPMQLLNLLGL